MVEGVDLSKIAVREPPRPKPKRFYKVVAVSRDADQWRILLDGKPIRPPLKKMLETPIQKLAEGIAAEWDAQREHIEAENMPLTRLLSTAIDRVGPERGMIEGELLRYVDSDLLCYRADHPADLVRRQNAIWQPVLDRLTAHYGVSMTVSHGVLPVAQPPEAHRSLRAAIGALDVLALTAFQAATGITSSLALSLAFVHGRLSADEVYAAAVLDETYQTERWGEDDEAAARRARIAFELQGIGRFIDLVKSTA